MIRLLLLITFLPVFAMSLSQEKLAENFLKKQGINLKNIVIVDARDVDFSEGMTVYSGNYEGFVVDVLVVKPTKFMKNTLPKNTSLTFVNNKIQRIDLPRWTQFKAIGAVCSGSVQFSSVQ